MAFWVQGCGRRARDFVEALADVRKKGEFRNLFPDKVIIAHNRQFTITEGRLLQARSFLPQSLVMAGNLMDIFFGLKLI